MKTIYFWLSLAAVLLLTPVAGAADLAWSTDYSKAQTQAKNEKKNVLLFFHGSDWCPTCKEMQQQVFDSPQFASYAREALVLVDVDFPEQGKQADELKRANAALKTKFNTGDNYPSIVLLSAGGDTLYQEAGYFGGGPAEVLSGLKRHTQQPADSTGHAGYKNVEVEAFARLTADNKNVILDVRTPKEFQAGHLPRAINLDVNAADFDERIKSLDKNKTYLVHCAAGVRSAKACEKFEHLDFPHLYNLTGGFKAWTQAGQPVEK
jgi:rhodanese-related sulfurtransferase/thioredoxin-related protein